jgi:hypothetical protein
VLFTQRFKQLRMTWGLEGGEVILRLRLAELSGAYDEVCPGVSESSAHGLSGHFITYLRDSCLISPTGRDSTLGFCCELPQQQARFLFADRAEIEVKLFD